MLFGTSSEALESAFQLHRAIIARLLQDDEVNHVEGTGWLRGLQLEVPTFQAIVEQYLVTISSVAEVRDDTKFAKIVPLICSPFSQ